MPKSRSRTRLGYLLGSRNGNSRGVRDRLIARPMLDEIVNKGLVYPGVYTSQTQWTNILGTGTSSTMTNVMEWTAIYDQNCIQPGPASWTQGAGSCPSHSATFFAGVTTSSNCAVEWQWRGISADYDQIDGSRYLLCK